ncbi:MAG: DUF2970 domain-containing protein [Pseudomonadales bacterium]|nr:DUF2970 domain-containing protein [Pseudomonadales bacterium]MDG2080103.1 DUF2970 domain-containing protein [Pseudomonadales bacterium]
MPAEKPNDAELHGDAKPSPSEGDKKLSVLHIITSVLAAAIGVQSKQNHEKDFSAENSIYIYLFSGIVFTLLFVLTVIFIVKTVLAGSI